MGAGAGARLDSVSRAASLVSGGENYRQWTAESGQLGGYFFFFQAEDGIRDLTVTGVQTCALPIYLSRDASTRNGSASCRYSGRPKLVRTTTFGRCPPRASERNTPKPEPARKCRSSITTSGREPAMLPSAPASVSTVSIRSTSGRRRISSASRAASSDESSASRTRKEGLFGIIEATGVIQRKQPGAGGLLTAASLSSPGSGGCRCPPLKRVSVRPRERSKDQASYWTRPLRSAYAVRSALVSRFIFSRTRAR